MSMAIDIGGTIDVNGEDDDDLSLWSDAFCFDNTEETTMIPGGMTSSAATSMIVNMSYEKAELGGEVAGCTDGNGDSGLSLYISDPTKKCRPFVLPNIPVDVPPSIQDADALLSDELNRMSLEERQLVERDLHGALEPVDESDSDFVATCLEQMQACLDRTDQDIPSFTRAYRIARTVAYVSKPSFRLMFLRSERFDPFMAARRMLLHLNEKRVLFGTEKLTKEHIELEDLDAGDKFALSMRRTTFLPFRDQAGRAILHIRPKPAPKYCDSINVESVQRAFWYEAMNALRDELTQIHGAVMVIMEMGNSTQDKLCMYRYFSIVREAIPLHNAATHFCIEDPNVVRYISLFKYHSSRSCRTRFQHHTGNHVDLMQELRNYGIAVASLITPSDCPPPIHPSSAEMALTKRIEMISRQRLLLLHRKRLLLKQQSYSSSASDNTRISISENTRLALPCDASGPSIDGRTVSLVSPNQSDKEDSSVASSLANSATATINSISDDPILKVGSQDVPETIEPTEKDVLWGRGKSRDNPGNQYAQGLVHEMQTEYERGNRQVKTQIARHIVERIEHGGGRFLKKEGEVWMLASNSEAREKIAKFFRKIRQMKPSGEVTGNE